MRTTLRKMHAGLISSSSWQFERAWGSLLIWLISLLCVLACQPVHAQVCRGNLGLTTQAQVNAFDCTEITGYLRIQGADITNVDSLAGLTSIGEYLLIRFNENLQNLDGFSDLTTIGSSLDIIENDALLNLDGFSSLTSLGRSLFIHGNDALQQINSLSKLTSIEDLIINTNYSLDNIDGLSNITAIRASLSISFNTALRNLDGLSNLTAVGGFLTIHHNSILPNLDGLSNLSSIALNFTLLSNDALANIDGLNNLTTIGKRGSISLNAALTNLDGLSNLVSIGDTLYITQNPKLSACICGLGTILNAGGIMGDIILGNNLSGCNSVEEILAATCDTNIATEDDDTDLPHRFTLEGNYPNPFNPTTMLRFGLPQAQRVRLTIYDALGREVAVLIDRELSAGWHTATFEAGRLASGVYLARLRADDRVETQRMILLK